MIAIELTGLSADLPLGAMAAFGVLRVLERSGAVGRPKLSWRPSGGGYHAVLSTDGANETQLVKALTEDLANATQREELNWWQQIKNVTDEQFHGRAEVLMRGGGEPRERAAWLAAYATELEKDKDRALEPTPFDMSVARQKFLADALRLAKSLAESRKGRGAKSTAEMYREALFGPWKYEDDQHSLGWDPSTMKLGAFTFKAPTGMANTGVRAAVWLAFESLPLFPCYYNRRLRTRAFTSEGRDEVFHWPVWQPPITVATLESLLAWKGLIDTTGSADELRARGVLAVYRSARFKPNKYLASFRTAELLYGGLKLAAG